MEQQLAKQKIKEFKRTRNLNMVKYTGLVYGILLFISGASKGSRKEDQIDFKKMFIGLCIISLSASIISDDKDRYDKETIGLIFATLILIALLFVQLNLKDVLPFHYRYYSRCGNILTQNIIKTVLILIIVSLMISFNYANSNTKKILIQTIPSIAIIIVVINTFTSFGVPKLPKVLKSMSKKWKKRKAKQKILSLLGLNKNCIEKPRKSKSSFGGKFNEKTEYFIDLLTNTIMPILYFISIIVLYAD